jgi:hypothetical protein
MTRLTVLICRNGLGHFVRAVRVLDRLAGRRPELCIDLYAERWQISRMADWGPFDRLSKSGKLIIHTEALTGSPAIGGPAPTMEAYDLWLARMREEAPVRDGNLVLSDNLVGVLSVRPDAVLQGSFLWHEVLSHADSGSPIADYERDLLDAHRPSMLCVREMAMPEVWGRTEAVPLGWYCEPGEKRSATRAPRRVMIAGGATGIADAQLTQIALRLAELPGFHVSAPPRIALAVGERSNVSPLRYAPADFREADLLIARPGMGALTDAVRDRLPVLCLAEGDNPEMTHNARRVEILGFGRDVSEWSPDALIDWMTSSDFDDSYTGWCRSVEERPCGGTDQAADWLIDTLDHP